MASKNRHSKITFVLYSARLAHLGTPRPDWLVQPFLLKTANAHAQNNSLRLVDARL